MLVYFKDDELRDDNLNVYGIKMRGNKDEKVSLDPERVGFIKERVLNRQNGYEKLKKQFGMVVFLLWTRKLGKWDAKNKFFYI